MLASLLKPKDREAARNARIARWDRPIHSGGQRLRAWLNMLANDHGIFRVVYLNLHKVTPQFWRAAQPTPRQIAALAGVPRGARQVARVLHSLSEGEKLPWHRVIGATGRISLAPGAGGAEQARRLKREGVAVGADGKVDLVRFRWRP